MVGVDGPELRTLGRSVTFTDEAVSVLTSRSQLTQTLLGGTLALKRKANPNNSNAAVKAGGSCDDDNGNNVRRKRELIPDEKKDEGYWDKRRKNNEAAKRSREKRRNNDMVLERRILGLLEENAQLRAELLALKFCFGLVKDPSDVTILPLSAPLCSLPTLSATHYMQSHTDGRSYPNAQPSTSTHHIQSLPPQQSAMSRLKGARAPSTQSAGSVSEESGISTSCSSNVGSPVLYDDTFSDHSRPHSRELIEEQQNYDSHLCPLEVNEGQHLIRQDSTEGLRSLPHKLRFKAASGVIDGREASLSSDSGQRCPPVATVGSNIQVSNHQQAGWDSLVESQVPWSRDEFCGELEQQYRCPSSGCYSSSPPQSSGDTKHMTEVNNLRSQINCLFQEVAQLKRLFFQALLSKIT
ncbi:hypothetical protein LDENG_00051210 [Lucifuga dentata]|nr:hypothetical protein LDENG_00051210 [Lucifuga dentata]